MKRDSKMRLVIDVGNTSITYGLFEKNKLQKKSLLTTKNFKKFKIDKNKITDIIYASVVPAVDIFFKKYFSKKNFKEVTYKNIPLIKIGLQKKEEVGIDRLVNAVGTIAMHKTPAVIIDFGSATTFCIIDKKNTYRGGLICPGINMSRQTLHEKTAKLPLIEINKKPKKLIGTNTVEAMEAGIFWGYQSMIDGILNKLKNKQCKDYQVIATGGYAKLISKNMEQKVDIVDSELTLKSLNIIGNYL